MSTPPSLSPEEIHRHNELYERACRLLWGLMILDDRPHKVPAFLRGGGFERQCDFFSKLLN